MCHVPALASALALAASVVLSSAATAAIVNVDMSGAVSGTTVTGVGASFASAFTGQSVSGNDLTGTPSGPLSLQPINSLSIAFFDPGVSAASNSILAFTQPLAILLDSDADSFALTMGFWNGGAVTASFYAADGSLLGTDSVSGLNGYQISSFSGFGSFRGVAFDQNTDTNGVRYMNFSYNSVQATVPTPNTLALVGLALLGLAAVRRST